MPLISVLMSIYNERIDWIRESVQSILDQSVQDFEFIIVIDNPELSKEKIDYIEHLAVSDSRIILLYNEDNIGLARSLNRALDISCGRYIARMDADDISDIERFEKELNFINSEDADMVSTLRTNIDEEGKILEVVVGNGRNPNDALPISNYIVHPSVMMKSNCIKELGGYRNFSKSQDYDLWLRMISAGKKIKVLEEPLIYYRIRTNSLSYKNKLEQYYISEYQKRLFKQRLHTGNDEFSEENLRNYLLSKKINDKKNTIYIKARRQTDIAIRKFKGHNPSFILNLMAAFVFFPEVPIKSIMAFIKMK